MRVYFNLKEFEPFSFQINGVNYKFSELKPLAEKTSYATNISELVYKLPSNSYVHLTIVSDEDQISAYGITRGWYVAETINEQDAFWLIKALEPFTAMRH